MRIGKKSINEGVIAEIHKLLKKKKLIKIKFLNNFSGSKEQAINQILQKTDSMLVLKMGNVFALAKQ